MLTYEKFMQAFNFCVKDGENYPHSKYRKNNLNAY